MRSMLIIGATLDDARDFIGDEHTANPRKLAIPDEIWLRGEVLRGEFCTPDTIPTGQAFDIVVVTASLFSPPSTIVSLASACVAKGGVLWREMPALAGFVAGGSFTVPDHGPVTFRATPSERVDVTPRDQGAVVDAGGK